MATACSTSYGDAIFWRGALAETAADAERDYRRVIVEYPLSPYADDALLSLAELEQARSDFATLCGLVHSPLASGAVFWPWSPAAPLGATLPLAGAYGALAGVTLLAAVRIRSR